MYRESKAIAAKKAQEAEATAVAPLEAGASNIQPTRKAFWGKMRSRVQSAAAAAAAARAQAARDDAAASERAHQYKYQQ